MTHKSLPRERWDLSDEFRRIVQVLLIQTDCIHTATLQGLLNGLLTSSRWRLPRPIYKSPATSRAIRCPLIGTTQAVVGTTSAGMSDTREVEGSMCAVGSWSDERRGAGSNRREGVSSRVSACDPALKRVRSFTAAAIQVRPGRPGRPKGHQLFSESEEPLARRATLPSQFDCSTLQL